MNKFGPYPQSFGARINGGAHFEPVVLVEENPVEDVGFTGSVFSDDSNNSDVFFLVDFLAEPFDSFLIDGEFLKLDERITFGFFLDSNQSDGLERLLFCLHF